MTGPVSEVLCTPYGDQRGAVRWLDGEHTFASDNGGHDRSLIAGYAQLHLSAAGDALCDLTAFAPRRGWTPGRLGRPTEVKDVGVELVVHRDERPASGTEFGLGWSRQTIHDVAAGLVGWRPSAGDPTVAWISPIGGVSLGVSARWTLTCVVIDLSVADARRTASHPVV